MRLMRKQPKEPVSIDVLLNRGRQCSTHRGVSSGGVTSQSITEPAVIPAALGRGPAVQRCPPRLILDQWLAACFQVA